MNNITVFLLSLIYITKALFGLFLGNTTLHYSKKTITEH